jgi:two-component system NarL family response regulator
MAPRKPALTGREVEVLGYVAAGMTSKQIGHVLFISENTVKNHVRNILDKLGLHSRNEAVLYAVRENLIEL